MNEPVTLSGGGYAIPAQAQTWSFILSGQAGPQLTFGGGPARLYGFLTGGGVGFTTPPNVPNHRRTDLPTPPARPPPAPPPRRARRPASPSTPPPHPARP